MLFPLQKYVWFAFRLSSSSVCYGLSFECQILLISFCLWLLDWWNGMGNQMEIMIDDTDQDSDPNATIVEITFGDRFSTLYNNFYISGSDIFVCLIFCFCHFIDSYPEKEIIGSVSSFVFGSVWVPLSFYYRISDTSSSFFKLLADECT